MKLFVFFCSFFISYFFANSQSNSVQAISSTITAPVAMEPLRFLASDELMGRSSIRPEIHIAARYISEQFRSFGLKELPNNQDYFQHFEIHSTNPVGNFAAKNVMGWVEGTDATLKNEFIIVSSHYDHLGISKLPKMEEGKLDSIYNGARDNAIGTTAVIDAARYFSKYPTKRSILFIAFSGEEMGLLGSKYFAANPPIELKKIVYDLNIDNASYNDTSSITLVGLGRTTADEDIKNACNQFGLHILPDPLSGRLFYGSDNTPLAEKGVPAPTYSLGMKSFDQSILNRYHQLSDEVGNFNLNYGLQFIHSYILAAQNIANNPVRPSWTKGDSFEPISKKLYQ